MRGLVFYMGMVTNPTEPIVAEHSEFVHGFVKKQRKARHVSTTTCNTTSSRCHGGAMIKLPKGKLTGKDGLKGQVSLMDYAGTEPAGTSKEVGESKFVGQSLDLLRGVIGNLVKEEILTFGNKVFPSYRAIGVRRLIEWILLVFFNRCSLPCSLLSSCELSLTALLPPLIVHQTLHAPIMLTVEAGVQRNDGQKTLEINVRFVWLTNHIREHRWERPIHYLIGAKSHTIFRIGNGQGTAMVADGCTIKTFTFRI